jgi:hypothetical protein
MTALAVAAATGVAMAAAAEKSFAVPTTRSPTENTRSPNRISTNKLDYRDRPTDQTKQPQDTPKHLYNEDLDE